MSKLYNSINTKNITTTAEAENIIKPQYVESVDNLYAAVQSQQNNEIDVIIEDDGETTTSPINRLYTEIIPERPSVIAHERIFVYVPKVTKTTPGIAKYALEQFNIVNGEVSLNNKYLETLVMSKIIDLDLINILTELPLIGEPNKLYLIPDTITNIKGYTWDNQSKQWISLGDINLNLNNYYTKDEIDLLINKTSTTNNIPLFDTIEEADLSDYEYAFIVSKTI